MKKLFRTSELCHYQGKYVLLCGAHVQGMECWDAAENVDCEPGRGWWGQGDYRPEGVFFKSLFSQSLFMCWDMNPMNVSSAGP